MKEKIFYLLKFIGIYIVSYISICFLISLPFLDRYINDFMYYLGDAYVNILFSFEQFINSIVIFCIWALIKPIKFFSGLAILLLAAIISFILWMFYVPWFYPVFFTDYFFTLSNCYEII